MPKIIESNSSWDFDNLVNMIVEMIVKQLVAVSGVEKLGEKRFKEMIREVLKYKFVPRMPNMEFPRYEECYGGKTYGNDNEDEFGNEYEDDEK